MHYPVKSVSQLVMALSVVILFCAVTIISSLPVINAASYYTAAVAVYTPHSNTKVGSKDDAIIVKKNNLASYEAIAKQAHAQNSAIIVFPEYGITGEVVTKTAAKLYAEVIPAVAQAAAANLNVSVIPCSNSKFSDSPALQKISCLAIAYKIVIVANMLEMQGDDLFNTNVAFDENGNLIAKYYKQHLYGLEMKILTSPITSKITDNSQVTFTTSFGVKFGTFTCLDILYCTPALALAVKKGIKHFAYPTFWGNSFPYLSSVHVRQGWSWRNNAVILSSGIDKVLYKFYSSGSGIFASGKPLQYHISGGSFTAGNGKVLVAKVPFKPSEAVEVSSGDRLQLNELIMKPNTVLFNEGVKSHTLKPTPKVRLQLKVSAVFDAKKYPNIFKNGFTCNIEYEFGNVEETSVFSLAANVYGPAQGTLYYAMCTLVKCGTDGCGNTFQSTGYSISETFTYLKITGDFPQGVTVIPTVLGNKLQLLDPSLFTLGQNSIELSGSEQKILSVNLYSKIYDNLPDGFCHSKPSNSNSTSTIAANSGVQIDH